MKKKKAAVLIFLLAAVFLGLSLPRSMLVLSVYNKIQSRQSLASEENFKISMPGGLSTKQKDWYPFVSVFCDNEGFSSWIGEQVKLTILYNFPAYSSPFGASDLYEETSPYYSSFYGAYLIRKKDDEFGFRPDGTADIQQLQWVLKYDYFELVLGAFGLKPEEQMFQTKLEAENQYVTAAGTRDWMRIYGTLKINGCGHNTRGFSASYLQYGHPEEKAKKSFQPVKMYGVMYVKNFKQYHTTIVLYGLCHGKTQLGQCEKEFLKKTIISQK